MEKITRFPGTCDSLTREKNNPDLDSLALDYESLVRAFKKIEAPYIAILSEHSESCPEAREAELTLARLRVDRATDTYEYLKSRYVLESDLGL